MNVQDIRCKFAELYEQSKRSDVLEIIGACFEADEPSIFGTPDEDYIKREIAWYESKSRNVNDIGGKVPKIWRDVASSKGFINSNYGFLFFDYANFDQFGHVVAELKRDTSSRRALAIYTRPSIHFESQYDGMQDFICTNAVQYLIRDCKLDVVVQMRSNDAVYGYKNDIAWQRRAQWMVYGAVKAECPWLQIGKIVWQVGSLHVYKQHFYLIDEWAKEEKPWFSKR